MTYLKRARTGCLTLGPSAARLVLAENSATDGSQDERFPGAASICAGPALLAGEQVLDVPGAAAVGSGWPVPAAGGAAGKPALQAIAEHAARGRFDRLAGFDGPFLVLVLRWHERELVAVRDKLGLRPAMYRADAQGLILADDAQALADRRGGVRSAGLMEWMHYGAALEPLSLFAGLQSLPPGCLLIYSLDSGTCRVERYYSPTAAVCADSHARYANLTLTQAKVQVSRTFDAAVAASVAGHDRVTMLLSGGVDSSLLAAHARRHTRVSALTFDIHGPAAESEYPYAREVAAALGVELAPVAFGPRQFLDAYCATVQSLGTPVITESAVALHHAAFAGALPRGQLILDGEGADDLLGGTTACFKYSLSLYLWRQLPLLGRLPARAALERLRRLLGRLGLETKSVLDGRGLDLGLGARRAEIMISDARIAEALAHISQPEAREITALMLREFHHGLAPMLHSIDRMSAVARTHTYLPYLSSEVFCLLQNLPMEAKIRWQWRRARPVTKFVTKELLAASLPRRLIHRPKMGFGIPVWKWMRMPCSWCHDSWVAEQFGLSQAGMAECLQKHGDHRDLMFLTSMEIWGRLFDRGQPLEAVQAEWLAGQGIAAARPVRVSQVIQAPAQAQPAAEACHGCKPELAEAEA